MRRCTAFGSVMRMQVYAPLGSPHLGVRDAGPLQHPSGCLILVSIRARLLMVILGLTPAIVLSFSVRHRELYMIHSGNTYGLVLVQLPTGGRLAYQYECGPVL